MNQALKTEAFRRLHDTKGVLSGSGRKAGSASSSTPALTPLGSPPGRDEVRLDEAIKRASEEERAHGRQTQCAFQRSQTCVTECIGMSGTRGV